MLKKNRDPMPRDAGQTRKRILDAATVEFARKGLGGARVDAIATRAKSNKRMIYHYFGSKEGLFTAARRGTFFLDEIGETTPSTQVKSGLSFAGAERMTFRAPAVRWLS